MRVACYPCIVNDNFQTKDPKLLSIAYLNPKILEDLSSASMKASNDTNKKSCEREVYGYLLISLENFKDPRKIKITTKSGTKKDLVLCKISTQGTGFPCLHNNFSYTSIQGGSKNQLVNLVHGMEVPFEQFYYRCAMSKISEIEKCLKLFERFFAQ